MANAGDKITSWQSLYDAINRVINLPATGSASAFTATTALDNNDVAPGNSIDDDDLNNLITRYNAIKTDSLYGSNSQLTTEDHTSTTIDLYSQNIDAVTASNLLSSSSDTQVNAVINNLNNIQCRNIVTCNNAYSYYCGDQSSVCNNCQNNSSCNRSYYSTCSRNYYSTCSQSYRSVCNNSSYYCKQSYYSQCGNVCNDLSCNGRRIYYYVCSRSYACSRSYYYTCSRSYSYKCSQSYSYSCSRSYYYYCSKSYYYTGCNQSYTTDCSRGTHNDIQCSNTTWSGS